MKKLVHRHIHFYAGTECIYFSAREKAVWMVSDARRKTDIKWFKENFGDACKTIRINCPDEIRKTRGWVYTPGGKLNSTSTSTVFFFCELL